MSVNQLAGTCISLLTDRFSLFFMLQLENVPFEQVEKSQAEEQIRKNSKADLGIVDEEDVLDHSGTSPLAVLIEEVFIPDLDIEIVVFQVF
jgi:hypothetical protein